MDKICIRWETLSFFLNTISVQTTKINEAKQSYHKINMYSLQLYAVKRWKQCLYRSVKIYVIWEFFLRYTYLYTSSEIWLTNIDIKLISNVITISVTIICTCMWVTNLTISQMVCINCTNVKWFMIVINERHMNKLQIQKKIHVYIRNTYKQISSTLKWWVLVITVDKSWS